MPTLSIERKTIEPRPILFIRRRVGRHEIAATIGQSLGAIFGHCQAAGIAVAGWPLTRYPEAGPGMITMETGLPIATAAPGADEIEAGTLHGGAVAFAVHAGGYETLGESYTGLERWIAEQGARPGGPPWEVYVTDPAEHPDPKDWRTEIYWPLAE
jgi:effector-binding domain-containing protein